MQRLRNLCIAIYADLYARRRAVVATYNDARNPLSLSIFSLWIYIYFDLFILCFLILHMVRLCVHCYHCKLVRDLAKLTPTINEVAGFRIFTTSLSCKASNNANIFIGSICLLFYRNAHSVKNKSRLSRNISHVKIFEVTGSVVFYYSHSANGLIISFSLPGDILHPIFGLKAGEEARSDNL